MGNIFNRREIKKGTELTDLSESFQHLLSRQSVNFEIAGRQKSLIKGDGELDRNTHPACVVGIIE